LTELHLQTPLLHSLPLSEAAGREVWIKLESAQPVGSFKQRGMGRACAEAAAAGATRVVTSSGGNAGLAVAWACRALGLACLCVVPESTSAHAKALIAAHGAEVRVHGKAWDDAHEHALTLCGDDGAYVHPFDHPHIWAGHATLVDECVGRMPVPAQVVVSVGGGGLLCGVVRGLDEAGWGDVIVHAVETEQTASYAAALAAGAPVETPIGGIATTLGARTVAPQAVAIARDHDIRPVQVSDAQAVSAIARFLDDHRVLVEPSCGAALALAYEGLLPPGGPVLMVVCGGAGATRAALDGWQAAVG